MLTVIQGHSGILLDRPDLPPEWHDSIEAVSFAAERAAALTRQLLMFSRRNVMQPEPLDLRTVVGDMTKLLKRLLGETITLEFHPPQQLARVQADTSMMEQVIMNLSVNARDAMPKGGTLIINTSPVRIDDAYVASHSEARAGEFVCLIGKSGCGKTTLLSILSGLERPTAGKVMLDGKDITSATEDELALFRRNNVGFIFQSFNLIPTLSAWENVALPLFPIKMAAEEKSAASNYSVKSCSATLFSSPCGAFALAGIKLFFPKAYGLGRHLHQLIFLDKLQRLLKRQHARRCELDGIIRA
jgi:hypothetical protein